MNSRIIFTFTLIKREGTEVVVWYWKRVVVITRFFSFLILFFCRFEILHYARKEVHSERGAERRNATVGGSKDLGFSTFHDWSDGFIDVIPLPVRREGEQKEKDYGILEYHREQVGL
jgi:hypothetical protein